MHAPQNGVLAQSEDAQEERSERALQSARDEREPEYAESRNLYPVEEGDERDGESHRQRRTCQREPVLETEAAPASFELFVLLAEIDGRDEVEILGS